MRDARARRDAGAIVRLVRRAADITLAELGKQVGYTAASLSRMERGKQPLRDVLLLQQLAACLDIPPHLLGLAPQRQRAIPDRPGATRVGTQTLFGEEGDEPVRRRELLATLAGATTSAVLGPPAVAHAAAKPNLSGLEDVLLHRQYGQSLTQDPTPAAVTAAVDASRQGFSACRYDALARALPARIALAQALGADGHPEQAATAVAELYTTTTRLCIKLGEDGLAAVTADRALTAALSGADALTVAEAHRMVSSAWRRQGHYARATGVAVTAAQQLTTDRTADATERLSVQGNLYATAAYTAAKQGDRHTAHALIAEAQATAGQLGRDALLRGNVFGPSQVLPTKSRSVICSATRAKPSSTPAASMPLPCPPPNARPATGSTSPAPSTSGASPTAATEPSSPPSRRQPRKSAADRSGPWPPGSCATTAPSPASGHSPTASAQQGRALVLNSSLVGNGRGGRAGGPRGVAGRVRPPVPLASGCRSDDLWCARGPAYRVRGARTIATAPASLRALYS
ncbi:helix-turn-helix domain-containing protein [Streptomyces pinistramenti]|uniref:helix-turn-helix domain-containing protein n=1 Tax=Streptomyces pinistramenti TaxID=2884812 RepID=UPI001D0705D1|nr:helix-turn-helix transcriptional regulator [Streptomyces pinistramenti]MCB5908666.1 helix-turn-helix domain-containing protein [Streptomyces pinistramenti]